MTQDTHPILAREGWGHIGCSLVAALAITVLFGFVWALPFWLFLLFVLQFFRDPVRQIPTTANAVVSPADGKVVALEPCNNPYTDQPALKISVFMNVFSVHSNRSPVAGTVVQRWYHPGKFLNAALDKASSENERNALNITTAEGHNIVCVQVAGLIARRILCYVKEKDSLQRGQRYGFIRFGSRVDIFLPPQSNAQVRLGEWVSAGSDTIAILP